MFVDVGEPDVERLIAAAPNWPTLEELWELAPPVPPVDDEWPGDAQPVDPAPFDSEPSGWLALDLDATTADPCTLSDVELIDAMAGFGRVSAWAQARQARVVAELDRRRSGSASRYTADEVALALSMSRFSANGLVERSRRLADTLLGTLAAFEAGRVDGFKVRVICDAVRHLDDAQAQWVQDRVLGVASGLSVAQLRAVLARAVIAADPEGANVRHRKARKERRVGVGQEQDGMSTVWASLAADDAQQVFGSLTGLARSLGAADPREMDARRADLLVGLMTGEISIAFPTLDSAISDSATSGSSTAGDSGPGGPATASEPDHGLDDGDTGNSDAVHGGDAPDGAQGSSDGGVGSCPVCVGQTWRAAYPQVRPVNPSKPLVQVLMAHSTLRGADHAPAELVGYGAICADQAREIAADAIWRRLVYDEESGAVLDHDRRTYRPPAALADHVRARDVHCRSPLCRRRAIDCELDHTVPFPHGPTSEPNLAAVCLLHHDEKHAPGWTVLQHPDGRIEWITPTGHVYSSEVHDYRPLPPPPPRSVPGPIADRTDTRPAPATTPGTPRVRHDWASTSEAGTADEDMAPF